MKRGTKIKKKQQEYPGFTACRGVFTEKLNRLIYEKGVSARQVSRNIGHSPTYVNKLQNGDIRPTLEIVCILADYFKVPKGYFIDD